MIGEKIYQDGEISNKELPSFCRKIIFLINSNQPSKNTIENFKEKNLLGLKYIAHLFGDFKLCLLNYFVKIKIFENTLFLLSLFYF